jgi:hypothetical protein
VGVARTLSLPPSLPLSPPPLVLSNKKGGGEGGGETHNLACVVPPFFSEEEGRLLIDRIHQIITVPSELLVPIHLTVDRWY